MSPSQYRRLATLTERLAVLEEANKALRASQVEAVNELTAWVRETKCGGWSTHQLQPQQQLAAKMAQVLIQTTV